MTADMKSGTRRFALGPMIAFAAATVGLPVAGLALAAGGATPAFAREQTAALAPAAPFTAIVAPGPLVADTAAPPATAPLTGTVAEPAYQTIGSGMASYYGRELAGNRTASGERFDPSDLTAAHRTLPLGSKVRVTNARTGDSVVVRINDRGPFHSNRLIDLSEAAAREIGIKAAGSGRVELAVESE